MDALQEIRRQIRDRDLPLLERPVFTRQHLRLATEAVAAGPLREGRPMDVPLRAIVGLGRDVCKEGQSWRHVVEHELHGDHGRWDERALAYFESEIRNQDFPALWSNCHQGFSGLACKRTSSEQTTNITIHTRLREG